MRNSILFILMSMASMASIAQDKTFGIKFSGYVKTDVFYDTRQSSAASGLREGHFYLFPDNVVYDADSNDVSANPSLNLLSIQSRLKGDISGPDAFGAKTSGLLETEFFGTSDADLNGLRLRHAYVKLNWNKTEFLIGQTWHPMFPTEAFAGTLSVNTGVPFTPFSRNPQLRFSYKVGKVNVFATAYSQRDVTSTGPDGSSSKYMRNSGIPGMNLRAVITASEKFQAGLGADYKTLRPELKTAANYSTDATIGSYAAFVWMKCKTKLITASLMGTYAQNATDMLMLGGYAVSEITDTLREFKTYSNLTTAAAFFDVSTNGAKVKFGLFGGYSKSMGSDADTLFTLYGRGTNIDQLMRISPRVLFIREALTLGAEVELTMASYGNTQPNGTVKPIDENNVMNIRFLISAIYKF